MVSECETLDYLQESSKIMAAKSNKKVDRKSVGYDEEGKNEVAELREMFSPTPDRAWLKKLHLYRK
jgi:hypothetical protein